MYSDDIAISVRNLTKTYRLFNHPGDRIKQFLSFGIKRYHSEFTALKDVSFEIRKGETVGIIGRNGSGKSTLLQLVCGIMKPTVGTVKVNGRVSALLELGAGFNPEFTGRENVYFQGALMGLTKARMDERFADIAAFADIGEFIDQPVRTYSSGMFVRLAFAVAVHVDPEILVVDEALAVGDTGFQAKCLRRIDAIRKQGGTILIVTHAIEQVAHHCDHALLLDYGRLVASGDTATTLAQYVDRLSSTPRNELPVSAKVMASTGETNDSFSNHPAYNLAETRWGDRQATIEDIRLVQNGLENPETLVPGVTVEVRFFVYFHAVIEHPIYGLVIKSSEGVMLFSCNSRILLGPTGVPGQKANDRIYASFKLAPFLDSGAYSISVGIAGDSTDGIMPHDRRYDSIIFRIAHPCSLTGDIEMNPEFCLMDAR